MNCLFDLDYEIINLVTGQYTLRVNGMYVDPGDQELEFNLQFFTETSGNYCVPRSHYPWR